MLHVNSVDCYVRFTGVDIVSFVFVVLVLIIVLYWLTDCWLLDLGFCAGLVVGSLIGWIG